MTFLKSSFSIQTTSKELFDPLYQIPIPNDQLKELIASQSSLLSDQLVNRYTTIAEQIALWLETAHMIAFTIEQSIKKTESDTFTIEPLETACSKIQPVIQQLGEFCDEQEELQSNPACKLKLTKIQSEWSGLQHFISSLKTLIEASNEKHMLRKLMETILVQIDDLSTMIFQFQEQRHMAAIYPEAEGEKKEDERILMEIDNRVGPLFNHVEKVYTRMTSATPPEDSLGLLTRKHILVQEKWECLRVEIDELKLELKEDRWLVVFKQVADQVDDMMNKLEKTVVQCYHLLNETNQYITSSSSNTSASSTSSNTINSVQVDSRAKLWAAEKNFEAKYKYYAPSIARMLDMLGNGIAARVSRNAATIQRHEAMVLRWNNLKTSMDQLRKSDLVDMPEQCWSRLSDRSDSTSSTRYSAKQSHLDDLESSFIKFKTPSKMRTASPSAYSHEHVSPSYNRSPDEDMITTKDFKKTKQQQIARSVTPNLRRSGTPSMIPRPKTPTSKASQIARPRSSMARITNSPIPKSKDELLRKRY